MTWGKYLTLQGPERDLLAEVNICGTLTRHFFAHSVSHSFAYPLLLPPPHQFVPLSVAREFFSCKWSKLSSSPLHFFLPVPHIIIHSLTSILKDMTLKVFSSNFFLLFFPSFALANCFWSCLSCFVWALAEKLRKNNNYFVKTECSLRSNFLLRCYAIIMFFIFWDNIDFTAT